MPEVLLGREGDKRLGQIQDKRLGPNLLNLQTNACIFVRSHFKKTEKCKG